MKWLLRLFGRNKNGEHDEEEVFSSSELPAPSGRLETPNSFIPGLKELIIPESAVLPERALHFPAALEFPEVFTVSAPESPDPAESLIRRISWDERRFSQSMTEE